MTSLTYLRAEDGRYLWRFGGYRGTVKRDTSGSWTAWVDWTPGVRSVRQGKRAGRGETRGAAIDAAIARLAVSSSSR